MNRARCEEHAMLARSDNLASFGEDSLLHAVERGQVPGGAGAARHAPHPEGVLGVPGVVERVEEQRRDEHVAVVHAGQEALPLVGRWLLFGTVGEAVAV